MCAIIWVSIVNNAEGANVSRGVRFVILIWSRIGKDVTNFAAERPKVAPIFGSPARGNLSLNHLAVHLRIIAVLSAANTQLLFLQLAIFEITESVLIATERENENYCLFVQYHTRRVGFLSRVLFRAAAATHVSGDIVE
jgi:hypothetical protein